MRTVTTPDYTITCRKVEQAGKDGVPHLRCTLHNGETTLVPAADASLDDAPVWDHDARYWDAAAFSVAEQEESAEEPAEESEGEDLSPDEALRVSLLAMSEGDRAADLEARTKADLMDFYTFLTGDSLPSITLKAAVVVAILAELS